MLYSEVCMYGIIWVFCERIYWPKKKNNGKVPYTGLFKMIVGVLTTCHTQYT
jgi:hypothetical protein